MPYKNPEKQKEAKRKYYRRKYAEDPAFVEAERQRKLAHYEANRALRLPQMRAYSQEWYAKIERKRRKALQTNGKKAPASSQTRRVAAKKPAVKASASKVARRATKRATVAKKRPLAVPAAARSRSLPARAPLRPPARSRNSAKPAPARAASRSRPATAVKKALPAARRRR